MPAVMEYYAEETNAQPAGSSGAYPGAYEAASGTDSDVYQQSGKMDSSNNVCKVKPQHQPQHPSMALATQQGISSSPTFTGAPPRAIRSR